MPPRKRTRGVRAASVASTNVQDSDSAMPDADDETSLKATPSLKSPVNSSVAPSLTSSKKGLPYKEPINDEWTDEQDTSLFKGLVQWKPVGMHRHFRMIALMQYLRNHGYNPDVETHTRPAGIWAHLGKYFDLETLGQREDHIDDDPSDPQYIEFSLPEEYHDEMWERGNRQWSKQRKSRKQILQNKEDDQDTEEIMESREVEEEDWNSSPPQFDPSITPLPSKKRKRADTVTGTRGSTVDDTDDAVSSTNSPSAIAPPVASSNRLARTRRPAKAASSSRQASKDITVDEEESRAGDDDNGGETDDTASVKATTRSNAKATKGGAQVTTRKSGRKR